MTITLSPQNKAVLELLNQALSQPNMFGTSSLEDYEEMVRERRRVRDRVKDT